MISSMKAAGLKRFILMSLSVFLLGGCSRYSDDLLGAVMEKLSLAAELPAMRPTYNSTYYRYYKEPYVGRISSDATSNIFCLNGTQFVMNLNVPGMINQAYYPGETVGGMLVEGASLAAETAGHYTDWQSQERTYVCRVYRSQNLYVTILNTDFTEFFAMSTKNEVPSLAYEMLVIAKSVETDDEEILSRFSNHSVISYQKKKLELFQDMIPVNGAIEELFVDYDEEGIRIGDSSQLSELPSAVPEADELWPQPEESAVPEEEQEGMNAQDEG